MMVRNLSFSCPYCNEAGEHVCRRELLLYIMDLPEDSQELAGLYDIYRQLVEATDD